MLETVYLLILRLLQGIQPFIIPFCFVLAWALVLITAWSFLVAIRDGVANVKRMHQIPCANCQFFSGDYHLKCPVHPTEALSEDAIGCPDYEPVSRSGFSSPSPVSLAQRRNRR